MLYTMSTYLALLQKNLQGFDAEIDTDLVRVFEPNSFMIFLYNAAAIVIILESQHNLYSLSCLARHESGF